MEYGDLSFKFADASIYERFAVFPAGIVDDVSGRQVVRGIDHDIVMTDDFRRIFRGEPLSHGDEVTMGVERLQLAMCHFHFRLSEMLRVVKDLALQIAFRYDIVIHKADCPDSCGCQVEQYRGTQSAGTYYQYFCPADFFLPGFTHFCQGDVPGIAFLSIHR